MPMDKDEVLSSVSGMVEQVLIALHVEDIELQSDGSYMTRCPFHEEKTRSFHVDQLKGMYNCFGGSCGAKGGDVYDMVQAKEGISFPEAVERIAEIVGFSGSSSSPLPSPPPLRPSKKGNSAEELQWLEEKYQERRKSLIEKLESEPFRDYIYKTFGIDREFAITLGLGFQKSWANNPARIIIPVHDKDDTLINMRKYSRKAVEQGRAKVTNEAGYGAAALLGIRDLIEYPGKTVLIVAGEKDWIVAKHRLGNDFTVLSSTGGEGCWKDEFTEAFSSYKGRVTICYDVDEAGQKGAEKVARSLQKLPDLDVHIIKWPEDFAKEYPKGDVADFYLEHNDDLLLLIDEAPKSTFTEPITNQEKGEQIKDGRASHTNADRWVERRDDKAYWVCYHNKKGKLLEKRISDFVIELIYNHIYEDGTWIREVMLKGRKNSKPFLVEPGEITNPRDFRRVVMSHGGYTFDGAQFELNEIWRIEFDEKEGREIYNKSSFGKIDDRYFLGNIALDTDGTLRVADENRVIWFGDGSGYKALCGEGAFGGNLPTIDINLTGKDVPLEEICKSFSGFWNPPGDERRWFGELFLGWVVGTMYSDVIFNKWRCYPICMLLGDTAAGKTSFLRFALKFFGFDTSGDNWTQTTQFALYKSLEGLSNICYVLDEFNDRGRGKLDPRVINSIYNRQPAGKGTKALKIRKIAPKGTLMISGRKRPDADDFLSRLVIIPFSRIRRNESSWERLSDLQEFMPIITLNLISEGPKDLIENAQGFYELLSDSGINPRMALNYSIAMAGAKRIGAINEGETNEMLSWLVQTLLTQSAQDADEEILGEFWSMLTVLNEKNIIKEDKQWCHKHRKEAIALHMDYVYHELQKLYRDKSERYPIRKSDLVDYLHEAGHLILGTDANGNEMKTMNTYYPDKQRKSILLKINSLPDFVRQGFLEVEESGSGDDQKETENWWNK